MGRDRRRRPVLRRRSRRSFFSPPSSSTSSESCREPQPKQAAAASGTARRPPQTAPPSHSGGARHVTEPSALCSRAAVGRLQPGSLSLSLLALNSGPSPPRARPSPPPGRTAEAPEPGPLLQRSGSAPAWPTEPGAPHLPCPHHPASPPARRNPRGGKAGVFGWLLESRIGVWENGRERSGEDAGVRGGVGGHCGCRAPSGRAGMEGCRGPSPFPTGKGDPREPTRCGFWVRDPSGEIYIF